MQRVIAKSVKEAVQAIETLLMPQALHFIESVASALVRCYQGGGKVIVAGNGGSLCDAMHFAEELTGFFRERRRALPALALADPGHLTCVANDVGFEEVFARGIDAHGKEGDLFVALTTSGNSKNLISAVERAKQKGLQVITFLGKSGGALKGRGDCEWIVPFFETSDRIQEAHMAAIHIIIEALEAELFESEKRSDADLAGTFT